MGSGLLEVIEIMLFHIVCVLKLYNSLLQILLIFRPNISVINCREQIQEFLLSDDDEVEL